MRQLAPRPNITPATAIPATVLTDIPGDDAWFVIADVDDGINANLDGDVDSDVDAVLVVLRGVIEASGKELSALNL